MPSKGRAKSGCFSAETYRKQEQTMKDGSEQMHFPRRDQSQTRLLSDKQHCKSQGRRKLGPALSASLHRQSFAHLVSSSFDIALILAARSEPQAENTRIGSFLGSVMGSNETGQRFGVSFLCRWALTEARLRSKINPREPAVVARCNQSVNLGSV